MLTKSMNFLAAEQAGKTPVFYIYADTDLARRCFVVKGSVAASAYTGFYDGSGYVGDSGDYGASLGTIQTRALVQSLPQISKTVSQGGQGFQTALSASSVSHIMTTFDNLKKQDGKFFFSNILTGESPETFLGGAVEVRMGYNDLDYSDELSLFRGITIDSPLKGPRFSISSDGVTGTLYDKWECPDSSRYANPAQANQKIPVVLGDCTENSGIDEDGDGTADKGPIPLVCIDTVNDVWAMASCALVTTGNGQSISLYDDDGLIAGGDYTYTASGDYESTGLTIAYVTFTTPPTGSVTGKYKGAPDSAGALITNPVSCAEKLLSIMGETATFEATTFQTAVNDADSASYTCAGLVMSDNPRAYWLGSLLGNFIGSWFLDDNDEIVVQIDTGSNNFLAVAGELKERSLRGHLSYEPSRVNKITRPILNYAISYSQIDRRFKNNSNTSYLQTYAAEEVTGDLSQNADLDWTRNTATATAIAARIVEIYAPLKSYKNVQTNDFSLVNLEPGDYFIFGSEWQYDDEGNDLAGQVGRVINIAFDLESLSISLDFYDTGNYLLADPDIYDGTGYVGDGLTYGGERV